MKKTFLASLVSVLILTSFGMVVYAQQTPTDDGTTLTDSGTTPTDDGTTPTDSGVTPLTIKLDNPFATGNSLQDLLVAVFDKIIFPIGGILAVLAFVYSGFLYVSAQGDTTKIQTAHNALLYSAIGTAVLLGARVIAEVISGTISQLQ
jgi:hypothetical protein